MVDLLDGIRCNLGRTLTAQGKVEEAMVQYKAIKNPDYFSQCGLALASLKGNLWSNTAVKHSRLTIARMKGFGFCFLNITQELMQYK